MGPCALRYPTHPLIDWPKGETHPDFQGREEEYDLSLNHDAERSGELVKIYRLCLQKYEENAEKAKEHCATYKEAIREIAPERGAVRSRCIVLSSRS